MPFAPHTDEAAPARTRSRLSPLRRSRNDDPKSSRRTGNGQMEDGRTRAAAADTTARSAPPGAQAPPVLGSGCTLVVLDEAAGRAALEYPAVAA